MKLVLGRSSREFITNFLEHPIVIRGMVDLDYHNNPFDNQIKVLYCKTKLSRILHYTYKPHTKNYFIGPNNQKN